MNGKPLRLRVAVDRAPAPALLRSAIAAALAGRHTAGPEGAVARAVVAAIQKDGQWR